MAKDLTTSIYTFENLIRGNFLYVDKTEYVWQLIRPEQAMYFLSRPRRFGKSLLISTLEAIFQGKKELFQGLAINDKSYNWKTYPVIHFDFANCDSRTPEELQAYLEHLLKVSAEELGLELRETGGAVRFENLINDAAKSSTTGQVVILIDEYDKPILGNIGNLPQCKAILPVLKGFYSSIKKCAKATRFAMITGVSKFCHVSLFSDLNNLTDITLNPDYAGMLGFTSEEIRSNFADRITDAAKANDMTGEELMRKLLEWYDGYRFSEAELHVCNPVSVSSFFQKPYKLTNYWASTGTPSFLLELMHRQSYDFEAALNSTYDEGIFSAYELDSLDITGLLWQTGYLTIRELVPGLRRVKYRLGFPDYEVEDTFMNRLLEHFCNVPRATGENTMETFQNAIAQNDLDLFMKLFQSFLANIPYGIHLKHEKYYQTVFFIFFRLLGLFIEAESQTNEGRIDAYVRTEKTVFIFEFKLDKSPDSAIDQIIDRRYYEKFQSCSLPIRMVGVYFNSAKGRIDGWKELALPN